MNPNERRITMDWDHDLVFRASGAGGVDITVDGDSAAGPSPMEALLISVGGCMGVDVVGILQKMRVDLRTYRLTISGIRREEIPKRYVSIHMEYRLGGEGLDEQKARRAIDLSREKYCSVLHTLAADIDVTYAIDLV